MDEDERQHLPDNLTARQYGQIYGKSIYAVRRAIQRGELPGILMGNRYVIPRKALDKVRAADADRAIAEMRQRREAREKA
jgi:hypothetical protein